MRDLRWVDFFFFLRGVGRRVVSWDLEWKGTREVLMTWREFRPWRRLPRSGQPCRTLPRGGDRAHQRESFGSP